ncbi:MAG: trehalose-phosphatase, partial [Actinomycetota bacterium]
MTAGGATGGADAEVVDRLAAVPLRSLVAVDFDGSLAPIVDDPADARPLSDVVGVLNRLTDRLGRVAVVSGRPVGFLAERLDGCRAELIGAYGAERLVAGERRLDPRLEPWREPLAAAARDAAIRFPARLVEVKVGIGVALHWRTAPEREAAARRLADELANRFGLVVLGARRAVELRAPVDIDKGTTVRALIGGMRTACFAGDDEGDLPAFAALRDAVTAGEIDRACCIGVGSAETPSGLAAAVDLLVDGSPQLDRPAGTQHHEPEPVR